MATTNLPSLLHRLGRRLLAVGVAVGLGWGLAAAAALLLAAVWCDLLWELPPAARAATWGLALLLAAGLLGTVAWRALRRRTPEALARRLDAVAGTGGQILSGVDLLRHRPTAGLTGGLADLAVAQAAQAAAQVAPSRAVPARPVAWSFGSLLLLGLGIAAGCLALPRLAWTQWLRFADPYGDHEPYSRVLFHVEPGDTRVIYGGGLDLRVTTEGAPVERVDLLVQADGVAGEETVPMFPEPGGAWKATIGSVTAAGRYHVRCRDGRSPKYRIDVVTVPKLEAVRFKVTPPAYTNRGPYEGPLPQGGLAGLPGTEVQVWAKSNRPLGGGQLTPPGSPPLALAPLSPQSPEVTATFVIRQAGKVQLRIVDVDGQAAPEPYTAPVAVLADERPFVRILEPKPTSFATPTANLPVVVSAEDDYGISRLQLFRSLNDSRAVPAEVRVKVPPPTRWVEPITLPLAAYDLQPGDEIKLFARVEDNDPAGPKGSESPVVVVRIIAQDEYDRMMRTQHGMETLLSRYQEAERRLENLLEQIDQLQKELEKLPPDSDLAKEHQAKLQELAQELEKAAEAVKESARKPLPVDLDRALTKELEKLAEKLADAAKDAQAMAKQGMPKAGATGKKLGDLKKKLGGAKQEFDQEAMAPLQHFAQVYPLLEDAARFAELYQRQQDLADRLQSLKDQDRPDDPAAKARMRDLLAEQQELHNALTRLLEDIESHAEQVPEGQDPKLDELRQTAKKFVGDVRDSGAAEAMTDAEGALEEFRGGPAARAALDAADILKKFVKQCNGQGGMQQQGEACLKFQPSLSQCLGNTLEQLLSEAGLKPGNGQGGGNGYSVRRNSLQNVGLYGTRPLGNPNSGGGGGRREATPTAGGTHPGAGPVGGSPGGPKARDGQNAGGSTEAAVPAPYRRKVAEYFQRLADETGK